MQPLLIGKYVRKFSSGRRAKTYVGSDNPPSQSITFRPLPAWQVGQPID